jgi:hypothetical protein
MMTMAYTKHNFQDGQVLTGAQMADIDEELYTLDGDVAALNGQMQRLRVVETGTTTLTNNQEFPFNNSKKTVALQTAQANADYLVVTEIVDFTGNVGDIVVTDKMTNGFAIQHTGSASSVEVDYFVIGGFTE